MNKLKDRLAAALAEKTLGSQADMARECGVSDSAVSFWFNGKTKALRGRNLINAARYLGVEPSWINEGTDLKPVRTAQRYTEASQYAQVARLPLPTGEDRDRGLFDDAVPTPLAFRREWIREKGWNLDCLRLFEAKGESMAPGIRRGDVVLVDVTTSTPANDEVWVIHDRMLGVRIRRILVSERGEWILRGDNADKSLFRDECIDADSIYSITPLGKVVWRGG